MKTAEERSFFKAHLLKLGQGRIIPITDVLYWEILWTEPSTTNDVFELLSPFDVRIIRDQNLSNFVTLIRVLILKLCDEQEVASETRPIDVRVALNCIRMLTKMLPLLFELNNEVLESRFWWNLVFDPLEFCIPFEEQQQKQEQQHDQCVVPNVESPYKLLAVRLIRCIVGLLFQKGFTLSSEPLTKLWEAGIGAATSKYSSPNLVLDSNRTETLRLLLTLISKSFYQTTSKVVPQGNRFLLLLVATTPRVELLTLVCSLLNLICRSARTTPEKNVLQYSNSLLTEMRHLCVTYSAQVLCAMVIYPIPPEEDYQTQFLLQHNLLSKGSTKPINLARLYFGKLHKENELYFIATYFMNVLRSPMESAKESLDNSFTSSFADLSKHLHPWISEVSMLLWELFQCNKNFKRLMREKFINELFILLLYHVYTFYNAQQLQNLVRIYTYFLLYLSSDVSLTEKLCQPMNLQFYSTFPQHFKCTTTPVTFRDAAITHICTILLREVGNTKGANTKNSTTGVRSDLFITSLVEILYNIIPVVSESAEYSNTVDSLERKLFNSNPMGGLSYASCAIIMQVINMFSTKEFILEKSFHSDLLALIIRSICTAAVKHPKPSRMLLFNILKNEKGYDSVWNTIYSLNTEYFNGETLILKEDYEGEDQVLGEGEQSRNSSVSIGSVYLNSNKNSVVSLADSQLEQQIQPQSLSRMNLFTQVIPPDQVSEEDERLSVDLSLRPRRPTGMSSRAKEKLPKDSPLKRSWGGNDSLRIILTIILPHLKLALKEIWSSKSDSGTTIDTLTLIQHIEKIDFDTVVNQNKRQINYDFLPETPIDTLKFNWSQISLGWYLSLLYGNLYNSMDSVKVHTGNSNKILKNISSSISNFTKFTSSWLPFASAQSTNTVAMNTANLEALSGIESKEVIDHVNRALTSTNHWSQTNITLFKIQAQAETFLASLNTKFSGQNNSSNGNLNGSNNVPQSIPGTPRELNHTLHRRLSEFRLNNNNSSRTSISSIHSNGGSLINTPIEEQEEYFGKRSSVSSLHSLNLINRSNAGTPRNSIAFEIKE